MWRELIQTLAQDSENTYEFAPAATYFQLERIEQFFNVKLPAALRQLLLETNGVRQVMFYNDERVPVGQIIWDTESVQRHNRKMRTDPAYQDF
ncbi:MAG: SMI1/KNR4 family protein, partial [Acidobacteriales bacterium]|nr:SMI1/KNR4 family protein [Terriglobales bacterium]